MRYRTVAFPVEHGGWGFLAEPLLLALLVAPSAAGAAITVATTAVFLLRHPAKLWWRNRHRLDASPRFRAARGFAALYVATAGAGIAATVALAGPEPLLPFLILAPAGGVYAACDVMNRGRRLMAELAAPMGLAASAPAIALAGGWDPAAAWGLWAILQARAVPSILYVRARLRLERGIVIDRRPSLLAHVAALAGGALLWRAGLAPLLTVLALLVLLVRCARGLSEGRRPARARDVGFAELAFGLGYVAATAAGLMLGA